MSISDIISGVLKTASDFMKNNRNWLNEQVKIICEYFENWLKFILFIYLI